MEINYDLLPKQKTQKHNLGVEIDLYPYATELYEELDKMGIIERIKEIPQLGVIKVKKNVAVIFAQTNQKSSARGFALHL